MLSSYQFFLQFYTVVGEQTRAWCKASSGASMQNFCEGGAGRGGPGQGGWGGVGGGMCSLPREARKLLKKYCIWFVKPRGFTCTMQ